MAKLFKNIPLVTLTLLITASCQRQPLCEFGEHTNSARIELTLDWEGSNLDTDQIYNISIYAYSQGDSISYKKVSGSIYSAYIDLPVGEYSLLVFNDFVGDLQGMEFSNTERLNLFSVDITAQSDSSDIYYQVESDEVLATTLGQLARWKMSSLEVSEDMVWCSYCQAENYLNSTTILEVEPVSVTTPTIVEVSIDNLNNAAYIEVTIKGLASGIYLSSLNRFDSSGSTTLYSLELDSRTYSSSSDGVAVGEINTFGKLQDETLSYQVAIEIILNNGEKLSYTRDITSQILSQDNTELFISLSSDSDMITLPESSSAGFGVENWGDNNQVELE